MAQEGKEDQQVDFGTTSKRFLVEEVRFICTEGHKIKGNGDPQKFILNLPLEDDESINKKQCNSSVSKNFKIHTYTNSVRF